MGKVKDITGERFGRLTVKGVGVRVRGIFAWFCVCDCGASLSVETGALKSGNTTSCGCFHKEQRVKAQTTHGMHRHPAYRSWTAMKKRCDIPSNIGYQDYGGRGISYCQEWKLFEGFWADMGPTWAEGMSIDRIDSDGNYEPSNCKWSTPKEQANNRRDNVVATLPDGQRMNITQAADYYGLDRRAVYARIRYGWPEADWFKPTRNRRPKGTKS